MTKFFKNGEIIDYFVNALQDESISFESYGITRKTLNNFLTTEFITMNDAEIMMNFINYYYYYNYEDFEPFNFEDLYDYEYITDKSLRGGTSKVSDDVALNFDVGYSTGMRFNRRGTVIGSFDNFNNDGKSGQLIKTEYLLKELYQKIILNNDTFPFDSEDILVEAIDISNGIKYNN